MSCAWVGSTVLTHTSHTSNVLKSVWFLHIRVSPSSADDRRLTQFHRDQVQAANTHPRPLIDLALGEIYCKIGELEPAAAVIIRRRKSPCQGKTPPCARIGQL